MDQGAVGVDRLDLLGEDVLAAGQHDQLLAAADDVQIALGVEAAEVAGAEEAVAGERLAGRLGIVPVAGEDVLAFGLDLARRLAAGRASPDRSRWWVLAPGVFLAAGAYLALGAYPLSAVGVGGSGLRGLVPRRQRAAGVASSSGAIRSSTPSTGRPALSRRARPGGLKVRIGEVSVRP